ncbi:hypothetical protein DVS28_b0288 (plasmid) [Euzebya pacifica]|uniref:Uncharacterized protein n=1 Tax=Euzebya pacifica TaxID=1608957 RepID=A0A346Y6G1_9ACTN|nr:hypothetical protein DVS28_b0288 [Euzebya pacifica]
MPSTLTVGLPASRKAAFAECIRRDALRANPVGASIIRSHDRRYGPVGAPTTGVAA